jgi:hypothetical protein
MEHVPKQEKLPSGKLIVRHFDDEGSIVIEQHVYGALDIGINFNFKAGVKVGETYFARRRMVSRRTYEKARTTYADMPAADVSLRDAGAELLTAAAKERRQRNIEAKQHRPHPDVARKNDAFCSTVMEEGRRVDAVEWIQTKSHTLGVRNWSSSKRLVDRLSKVGCVNIYACEIDDYDDHENTGHLVIELPTEAPARRNVLKMIDRLAAETGYEGPLDDGQRYAYVKLD